VIELTAIGRVESELTDQASAPKQGGEGAPDAWLVFEPWVLDGLADIRPGAEVIVLTWLDRAQRDVLRVHPRDDPANPLTGVFATRSADRPNPVGLHPVEVLAVDGARVRVRGLEAVDGTPIVDVKPVLPPQPAPVGDADAGADAGARAVFAANRYMVLGTADEDGRPWTTPVWCAREGYHELYWVSDPTTRHSRNIAARREISIVVFDSQVPVGSAAAVYMQATAQELTGAVLERGMEVFARENAAQGLDPWTLADVTAPAKHRLYRATVTEHWVLDPHDERVPIQPA
jgi:tRNA-Thr(GGU) m(6)t(6)A37 methyltransferase TsaA